MYKRKARVVFWCADRPGYCLLAAALANRLGEHWLEARAAAIEAGESPPYAAAALREIGIDLAGQDLLQPSDALLAWADLVVALGSGAEAHCPPLPAHVQKKHWALPAAAIDAGDADDLARAFRAAREDFRARVEGMVGGLRLLAKSDSGED